MQQQARELGKDKSHQEEWKNKGQYQQHSRVEFSTYQRMQRMENSKRSSRQQNQVKDSQPLATCDRFELQQNKNQLILQMQNSQRQIFEQQIQLLRCQIQQQNKRQVKLKDLINTLSQQIKYQRQTEEENFKLSQLNEKLLDGLKQVKSRHSEEAKYYDNEIGKLKEEIHDKINQNERLRVEYQKRQLVYEQKVSMLESIIQKKCHRVNDLEKKIHQQSISKLKQTSSISPSRQFTQRNSTELGASTLRVSQIDHYDTENNMRASNLSMISKKSKASDLIKMNKSEMKNIMGVLIKSKRQLEKVHGDKSTQNYGYKQNKTMLN